MSALLTRRASLLALGAAALYPAAARAQTPFERDRQSILAMTGDYHVRFDMRETVSFLADYTPLEPKMSGGYESVRVAEDDGERIVLQHLLVAEHEGRTFVIKHWRQDWIYQPSDVLVYAGENRWRVDDVAPEARAGAWSQTVWQTDDSPRYGGVGVWSYDDGAVRWTSDETWRPLPRRDAIRNPPYRRLEGTNRHALTPNGWVHEQDNAKIGPRDGQDVTFVHEVVLNTYARSADYDIEAADDYWDATKEYWSGVRAAWDQSIARGHGVYVEEEPNNGSVTGSLLMGLADEIAGGDRRTGAALAEAQRVIGAATRGG
jgi:hypothetical protein